MADRDVAEAIVAKHIDAWGWGPLDEIVGLSEHRLAVDACAAGLAARLTAEQANAAEIERLTALLREARAFIEHRANAAGGDFAFVNGGVGFVASDWLAHIDSILNKSAQTTASENPHHG